jgi:hypothetical protein
MKRLLFIAFVLLGLVACKEDLSEYYNRLNQRESANKQAEDDIARLEEENANLESANANQQALNDAQTALNEERERWNAEQICLPVRHNLMAENILKFILQTSKRHIEQEEKTGRKEINKAKKEARAICMPESHPPDPPFTFRLLRYSFCSGLMR